MIRQASRSRDKCTDNQRYRPFPVPCNRRKGQRRPSQEKRLAQDTVTLNMGLLPPSSRLCPQKPTGKREGRRKEAARVGSAPHTLAIVLCPYTYRLPHAAGISQNPTFARMPLMERTELSVRSPSNHLLRPPKTGQGLAHLHSPQPLGAFPTCWTVSWALKRKFHRGRWSWTCLRLAGQSSPSYQFPNPPLTPLV